MIKRPIKVLAVINKLVPAGLENRLMDIIRCVDRNRVIIDVFTYQLDQGLYDEEVRSLGGTVYYNPPLTIQNAFWYVRYFRDFLRAHPEYKIVHSHQDAWCSVFCKGAYLADVPIRIAHSRTAISFNSLNLKYMVKNIIKKSTKKYANHYFAVSEKAGKWLYGNKLYDEGKVQIWPNAIDADKFYYNIATRNKVRAANNWVDKYVVMHVGNFTPPKNHPFIMEIFTEIHKRDNDAILVLVGTGDRGYVDDYITKNNLSNCVQLLGSRIDVNELLQGADVFLFPSIFEGLPGAMVEAQAAGLPCVMSDSIAKEIVITPNLTIKSLSESGDDWAESVLEYKTFERKYTRKYVEEKGFDIHSLTENLCRFYEEAYKEGENWNGSV